MIFVFTLPEFWEFKNFGADPDRFHEKTVFSARLREFEVGPHKKSVKQGEKDSGMGRF